MKERDFAKDYLIFKCLAGSHAYGTSLPTSDRDERGVFIAPPDFVLSCVKSIGQGQVEHETEDDVVFELRKFMNLAAQCNPNIIELLFTDDENVLFIDWPFNLLRDNRHLFLSKKAKFTFSGYAMSQMKRIKGHHKWITQESRAIEKLRELFKSNKITADWVKLRFSEAVAKRVLE